MMTYAEKLLDPRWQRRKTEILQRDDFACQRCGRRENTLHVHHKFYIRGQDPWDYGDDALSTLCDKCHNRTHCELEEAYQFLALALSSQQISQLAASVYRYAQNADPECLLMSIDERAAL